MNTTLLAFHNDQAIKDKYLARVRAHAAADEIINGQYWEDGRGCAVGCTIHGSDHSKYETQLGIPTVLARLEDKLFESIYTTDPIAAKAWPGRFLTAPRVGADLTIVWPRFAHWLLVDPDNGVLRFAKKRTKKAIGDVAALYARWIAGDRPTKEEWVAAADAADAAADADAYAADDAAAAAAAASACAASSYAADAASCAADAAYAASAASRATHYKMMADKLIALMQEA